MPKKHPFSELDNSPIRRISLYISLIWLFVFISSLAVSAYVFLGFLDGGRSWIGLLQVLCLCFGVSTVVYIPALVAFFLARRVCSHGPTKKIGLTSLVLALPWIAASIGAFLYQPPYQQGFIIIATLGIALSIWALFVIFYSSPAAVSAKNNINDSKPV